MKVLNICLALIGEEPDKEKFEKLYYQYRNLLFYIARKRLTDEHHIEDAVSTAFVHIAENMYLIKEPVSDDTKRLLITMVDRAAINVYKKEQRIKNATVPMDEVEHMTWESKQEDVYMVAEAIEKLPELYRELIMLRYADGYTNREIAMIMDFTVTKVDKILSRARKQLAVLLKEV